LQNHFNQKLYFRQLLNIIQHLAVGQKRHNNGLIRGMVKVGGANMLKKKEAEQQVLAVKGGMLKVKIEEFFKSRK